MVRKKTEPNRIDDRLDDLLADCQGPEDILGESGLLKQLSTRLVERALAGELSHHLAQAAANREADSGRRNSRNGYSKKTVQSTQGDLDLSIVYLDALYVNIKVSGRVSKRAVYVVLGVTVEGTKSLLGLWIGEAEAEGAKW
jgi:transposase-like protein